jgi:hypothetical protein
MRGASRYVTFPPIPGPLIDFVRFDSIHKGCAMPHAFSRQMDDRIRRLEGFAEGFRKKSEEPLPEYRAPSGPRSPVLLFLQKERARLRRERMIHRRSVFADLFTWLSITTVCFRKCLEADISVCFDFDRIDSLAEEQFESNSAYQQLHRQIRSLDAALASCAPQSKALSKLAQTASKSLAAAAWHYNGQRDFAYMSAFDVHLHDYFIEIGIELLDLAARALSPRCPPIDTFTLKYGNVHFPIRPIVNRRPIPYRRRWPGIVKAPNFEPLQQLYHHLVEVLNADTPEKQGVVRCALLRLVADRLYVIDPMLNTANGAIMEGLKIMRQLRVEEMNLPSLIFESSRSERICDLARTNQVVGEVVSFLEVVQFICSPFDIAESISTVSTTISGITRFAKGEGGIEMCFDDFFAVFAVVFAASPLVNACGIAELFAVFGFLEYPGILKHAVTAFCAWVEFVEDFPKQRAAAEAGLLR